MTEFLYDKMLMAKQTWNKQEIEGQFGCLVE